MIRHRDNVSVRLAAKGMQFPWRWNGDTISLNLGVIWEMSVPMCGGAAQRGYLGLAPVPLGIELRLVDPTTVSGVGSDAGAGLGADLHRRVA